MSLARPVQSGLLSRAPAGARGREVTPALRAERRQLCVDMAVLKERLARAGLYRTYHKMDEATRSVGYEVALLETEGGGE